MSDEGLAVGAALAEEAKIFRRKGIRYEPREMETVYLGPEFDETAIARALETSGLQSEHLPGQIEERVAGALADGKVVARFDGRMEYGPRALGNRSILYQPGDPSVNDWLNDLLRRTEFMPFAPAALYERADDLFENAAGGRNAARFMTVTFHCTPWMRERCAGVVHVDNTARPQLVREADNPAYYRIIKAYEKRTGVPAIINTSFNIHEEPIVCSPDDAIRAFLDSSLDYLSLGEFFVTNSQSSAETRKKWQVETESSTPKFAPTAT